MKTEATFVLMAHLTFGLPSGLTLSCHLEVLVIHECTWAFMEFRTLCQVLATPGQIRREELTDYQGKQVRKNIIIEQPIHTAVPVRFECPGILDVIHFAELGIRMHFPKLSQSKNHP